MQFKKIMSRYVLLFVVYNSSNPMFVRWKLELVDAHVYIYVTIVDEGSFRIDADIHLHNSF